MIPYTRNSAPVAYYATDYVRSGRAACSNYLIPVKSPASYYVPSSRSGNILPGYRRAILNGTNATTPYDALFLESTRVPGHVRHLGAFSLCNGKSERDLELRDGFDGVLDAQLVFPVEDSTLVSTALNRARGNLGSSIQDVLTPFQGGVFLGEIRQTVSMMKSPLLGLRKLHHSYLLKQYDIAKGFSKSRVPVRKLDVGRAVTDTYLEAVFGWLPLLNDLQGLEKALTRKTEPMLVRANGNGSAEKADTNVYSMPTYMATNLIGGQIFQDSTHKVSANIKAGIRINGMDGTDTAYGERYGAALSAFLPTVYNLIPWSFVVDYFTNIGDIVNVLSVPARKVAWQSQTYLYVTNVTRKGLGAPAAPANDTISFGSAQSTRTHVVRSIPSIDGSLITPTLSFDLPTLKQGLNIAALYHSLTSANDKFRTVRFR